MGRMRWLLCLCAVLCLSGCGQAAPQRASDGLDWSESWVTVGNVIGVDTPEGLTLRENSDTLAAKVMYYASWSLGDGVPFVSEDGGEAELYDAQVCLLLSGHASLDQAEAAAEEWLSMAQERYAVEESREYAGEEPAFTVLTYTFDSEEQHPYAQGASAFGVYGNYAVSVECICQEGLDRTPEEMLSDFLARCHYAA